MWEVNGIPMPDILDEVVQWDITETGMTQYEVDGHNLYVFSLVPRANTPRGRTITRHEFLHAEYDNPRAAKNEQRLERGYSATVTGGVADAFVHAVYWPRDNEQANRDAVQTALEDLRESVTQHQAGARINLPATLRSLAILKTVGTLSEQLEGSKLALRFLTASQLSQLRQVLTAVLAKDRALALKLFNEVEHGGEG